MIRMSIRRPVAVSMAYLAVALLGVAAWRNIPIELLPDTDLPQLNVTTEWASASPEAMEAFVTAPLEAAIQQVRGVEKITSYSEEDRNSGSATCRITVEFERDTDMDFVRLELSERLAALEEELPDGVRPPQVQPYTPREFQDQRSPFLRYTVTGPLMLEALREHVDDHIVPELTQVDGVATVFVYGGRDRVLAIRLDEEKINALGLNSYLVAQRIGDLEYVAEAGQVESGGLLRTVAIRNRTESADEIRRTALLTDAGRIVRVEDVATVHDTFEEPYEYYRIDGQPAVAFLVYKEAMVNTVRVADMVKARIEEIAGIHPPGVRLILDDDESEDIKAQLQDLRLRASIAGAVIFLVLLVFLRSFRSAGIVFATIAFSILIALNLTYFSGLTLNVLTLMGLAMGFGLIVDNAIVVLENIYRKRQEGLEGAEAAEAGSRQVMLPIFAATLTTLIVFIPFVYLQGELRIYYVPLAIVVGMSLLASLFVAFTFIPALASKVLGRRAQRADLQSATCTPQSPFYVRFYSAILGFTLRLTRRRHWPVIPLATVAVAAAIFGGSYYLFYKYVNRGIVWGRWGSSDTYISIQVRLPRGSELDRTDELTRFFEDKLKQLPEIEQFVTQVSPQWANIRVTFPDSLETTLIPVAIKEQLLAYSYMFGGAEVRVYGYGPSFYGGGGGSPNYSIKVLGYNYEKVREIAEDLGRRLSRFSRVRDVDVNSSGMWYERDKASEFVMTIDRQRLGLYGLTTQDVIRQVRVAVSGQESGVIIRVGGEEMRFEIGLAGNEDLDVMGLNETLLQVPGGEGVRLADVATVEERQVLNRIVREDQQYQRNVSYEFRGPQKLGDRVHEGVMAATALPARVQGRGQGRVALGLGRREADLRRARCLAGAHFHGHGGIVRVAQATAGCFADGADGARGCVPDVLLHRREFHARGVDRRDHDGRHRGEQRDSTRRSRESHRRVEGLALAEATVKGTLERVRPILMTSVTTIFGLLPLVMFSEYADANIWNALGYALIGGLASSTLFVLTVTPALYFLFELRPERRRQEAVGMVAAPVLQTQS